MENADRCSQIVVHYSKSAGPAQEVAKAIEALGAKALVVQADSSAANFGTVLVDAALKGFQTDHIDIVVNNAGVAVASAGISEVSFEQWDHAFHVNVRGPSPDPVGRPHMPAEGASSTSRVSSPVSILDDPVRRVEGGLELPNSILG